MQDKKWIFGLITLLIISFMGLTFGKAFLARPFEEDPKIIFYYSYACPHCKTVEEYMDESGIREKISIVEKEVSTSQQNVNDLYEKAGKCGIDVINEGLPVPVLWNDGTCHIGDVDIINHLKSINQ
jgi:glutaredoxin